MELTIAHEVRDRYLRTSVKGEWKLADVLEVIDIIRAKADSTGRARMLVDVTEVREGPNGIPTMDRFFSGERISQVLGGRIQLAVVARPENIDKFGETVAVNRGARMLVVDSEEEALGWLLK